MKLGLVVRTGNMLARVEWRQSAKLALSAALDMII
jgi:hypothetical protein